MISKSVGIIGFDGVVGSHLAGCVDAFAAACLDDGFGNRIPCYNVVTIGALTEQFRSESGMLFRADRTLKHAPQLDTIIVIGGPGLRSPEIADKISHWISHRAARTQRIASVCTGIYGVAPTGLLDGREVTTHWRAATDLAQRFPNLRVNYRKPLVKDGAFYSSSGATAGIDLSLALIEEDFGRYVAMAVGQELATHMMKKGSDDVSQPSLHSAPNDRFADLVSWIVRNLHEDLSVEVLARRACMCPRHFSRAFKSLFGTPPSEFVQNLRLNEARRRLSTPRKTLRSVAASVGFTDPDAFHRAFERRFGTRPINYVSETEAA